MNDLPKYWEENLKKAKIENFHCHDLRRTFPSRLVMAGADQYTVKKLLGHHDMKMTERYAHLAPDFLKGGGLADEKNRHASLLAANVLSALPLD